MKKTYSLSLMLVSLIWIGVACSNNGSSYSTSPSSNPTATSTPTTATTPGTPTATPTPATLTFLYTTYISTAIGSSSSCLSCHGSAGAQGTQLNCSSKTAFYNSTVGTASSYGCGTNIVTANNTSQSALYNRLSGSSCSPQMPDGGPTYLNSTQLAQFASWINNGAPNN